MRAEFEYIVLHRRGEMSIHAVGDSLEDCLWRDNLTGLRQLGTREGGPRVGRVVCTALYIFDGLFVVVENLGHAIRDILLCFIPRNISTCRNEKIPWSNKGGSSNCKGNTPKMLDMVSSSVHRLRNMAEICRPSSQGRAELWVHWRFQHAYMRTSIFRYGNQFRKSTLKWRNYPAFVCRVLHRRFRDKA